jgi:F0F1-type ATP synthase epsilon subunit
MTMTAKVIGPDQTLYDGPVTAIGAVNDQGKLSLLSGHANFISLIKDKIVLHSAEASAREITLNQGVLYCRNNRIEIYLGISAEARGSSSGS